MGDNKQGFVQPPTYPQQQFNQQQGYSSYPPQQPQQQPFPGMVQQPPAYAQGDWKDAESAPENFSGGGFDDKAVRRGFIKRVYSILMVQLVITASIISLFVFVDSVKGYVRTNRWIMWTSWGLAFACIIAMSCFSSIRRKTPHNFIFLGIFTICEGVMLGTITSYYDVDAILIAVGITAAVTLGLTLFAFQTKIDFTMCGGLFFALLIILLVSSIILGIVVRTSAGDDINRKYMMIGIGAAGAFVFSLYLIYDTQMMMGGNHKYALDPEEYIFAALNIYLDVINLFMYILMIVGGSRSD